MSRRRKYHIPAITTTIENYAKSHMLDFHQYSEYHMRLMDGGYTVLDIWTTGRYYFLTTDYLAMIGPGYIERGGEKGEIPTPATKMIEWLDKAFFPDPEALAA